jgi:hypothetical protein
MLAEGPTGVNPNVHNPSSILNYLPNRRQVITLDNPIPF